MLLVFVVFFIIGLGVGLGVFFWQRRRLDNLHGTVIVTETTDIGVVCDTISQMQQSAGDGRGYFEMKGRLWAREPITSPLSNKECALYTTSGNEKRQSSPATQPTRGNYYSRRRSYGGMFFMGGGHHHHSSSSKSNSKSNNNNGGIVILIGIALATLVVFLLSKFIQRKSNADIASGIDVVLADENENIVYVDISEEAEIMLRHEVTQNGLTEGYLRNGGGAYVVGTVYTDGDQIHVGPGDKDHPLIVSSFTEEELVAKFEKSKTTALIVSLCIFAAISGIPTLLFGLLVAWS